MTNVFARLFSAYVGLLSEIVVPALPSSQLASVIANLVANAVSSADDAASNERGGKDDPQIRVQRAMQSLDEISHLLGEIQHDLTARKDELSHLLEEISNKEQLVRHYGELAATSESKAAAFRLQLEQSLRAELVAQARKGRSGRLTLSVLAWLFTLLVGAALGAYFLDIVAWIRA